uniref:Plac8 onzin related protein 3 n=1 Tax=Oryzias sinensis TaxID=183150 RepID=A0A8C7YCB6_9TELE
MSLYSVAKMRTCQLNRLCILQVGNIIQTDVKELKPCCFWIPLRHNSLVLSGCFAFWCFPCFACITSKKAGECLCLPLLDGFGCIPPITTAMRVSIRKQYGIEGTICRDCVLSFFCGPCSWCQISREMKIRKAPMIFAA